MRYDIKLNPTTKLERHVARWLRSEARDREGSIKSVYRDLAYGGCASGMVGHLIYYTDTARFYRSHAREIDTLLSELCDDFGATPGRLFARAGWDDSDPLARDTINQNLLAWFGFEETARRLVESAED